MYSLSPQYSMNFLMDQSKFGAKIFSILMDQSKFGAKTFSILMDQSKFGAKTFSILSLTTVLYELPKTWISQNLGQKPSVCGICCCTFVGCFAANNNSQNEAFWGYSLYYSERCKFDNSENEAFWGTLYTIPKGADLIIPKMRHFGGIANK